MNYMGDFDLKGFLTWLCSHISGKAIIVVIVAIFALILLSKIVPILLLIIGIIVIAVFVFGGSGFLNRFKEMKQKYNELNKDKDE